MKILLDTHVLLWLAFDDKTKLSKQAIDLLEDLNNELYFSIASFWEIAIKSSLNRADFNVDLQALEKGLLGIGFQQLPIALKHILKLSSYPFIHKDPFDRLLLAQADTEQLYFLTADQKIVEYQKPFIINARN